MNESLHLCEFTDCLLDLVASFIDKNAKDISIFMDLSEKFLYIICEGVGISFSNIKYITNRNYSGRSPFRNNLKDYTQILGSILLKSEKVVIESTPNIHNHAYKVVFERGGITKMSKMTPKKCICTEIMVEGLLSIFPHRIENINVYEYFLLRSQISAMALITYQIPIKVTDKKFGEIIKWPGKYTGLGSAFSALIQSDANEILPVYANFQNIRMKAFLGLRLQCNKYLQYIYINHSFVMWKFLYKLFNYIVRKSFELHRRGKYYTFVLNIECPDTECLTYSRYVRTEIRPKNLNSIMTCFYLLFNNIDMLKKCVRNVIKDEIDELTPIQITSKSPIQKIRHKVKDIVFNQQCMKCLNRLSRCSMYPIQHDFQNLSNPSELLKYDLDFNYIGMRQILFQSWLELKQIFHNSHLNLSDISVIYKVINNLLNRCTNTQTGSREFFYFLVNILSFVTCKPILKDTSFEMKSINKKCFEIKEKSDNSCIEKADSKFSGKRKCEVIACSTNKPDTVNKGVYHLESSNAVSDYYSNLKTDILLPKTEIMSIVSDYSSEAGSQIIRNPHYFRVVLPDSLLPNNETSPMHLKKSKNENAYQHFNIVSRNLYVPKGASPIMTKKENSNLEYEINRVLSRKICSVIDETINVNRDIGRLKKPRLKKYNIDIQLISKDLFSNIEVIGQFDNKYIVCAFEVKNQYEEQEKKLIIFDQHGIDERVLLESILMEFIDDPENRNLTKHTMKGYWILLNFRSKELKLLLKFTNYFSKYGIEINSFSRETLTITSIPKILCWLAEYWTTTDASYYYYLFTTLKQLVEEQLESILKTRYTTNVLPAIIHKHICRTACSSAVKFGRCLSLDKCKDMINKLAKCKIPFKCAHGRPTALVINGISAKNEDIPPSLGVLMKILLFEDIWSY